jgi:hypothetical protein
MTEMCRQDGRAQRALGVALLAALALLAGAGQARAATYHAYLCRVPFGPSAGAPAATDGVVFTHNTSGGSATDSCPTGGTMTAALDGGAHAFADGASLIYTTPGGMTIAAFSAWRHERAGPVAVPATPFTNVKYTGAASAEGAPCQQNGGCVERGVSSPPFAADNQVAASGLSDVTELRFDAFCGGSGGTCPATGTPTSTSIDVFAVDALLNDPAAPSVTGAGGPLLAGGTLTGVQSASFTAADAGGGVHKGSIAVDGTIVSDAVLDAAGGACADLGVAPDGRPSFSGTQPCPSAVNGALALDTDLLPAGAHDVVVRVGDAAGNQTVVGSAHITTTGPRPAGANGSGASRFAKLTARFTSGRTATRRMGYGTRPTISGRLLDEHGAAITGAAIDVLVRPRSTGARSTQIATLTTGADGRFRVRLPRGPSRTITVAYKAFGADPKPSAHVRLRALVRARVSASAGPRAPRAGQPVRLSGRLRLLPRRGVLILIQARQGRTWRTVDTVETRSGGRFSWPYRFTSRQAGRTFLFRARVKSANYPFEPGNSAAIAVRVRR